MATEILIRRVESARDLEVAQAIRHEVFVVEQGIPAELDFDAFDAVSIHVLAFEGTEPIATARLTMEDELGHAVMARVAVLAPWRGRGLGREVVLALERIAAAEGVRVIELHPHAHLERFYAELGYRVSGGETTVGPHRLITMRKALSADD